MGTAWGRALSALLFARMALRYWLDVYPRVAREMRYWNKRARRIPDRDLRELALRAQRTKRGNVEGACAFAALVPHSQRAPTVRMLVAWQAAYDYVDLLAEQPCRDRSANARQSHLALLRALQPDVAHDDYYAHYRGACDGEYLRDMVDATRAIFGSSSNIRPVAPRAERAVVRIIEYQRLNQDRQRALARWAESEMPPHSTLRWWEIAAAGASSLAVLALLTAAVDSRLSAGDIAAIEQAYYPWIGALHTLLDSLIDLDEDAQAGQVSLLVHYSSTRELAARTRMIALHAKRVAEGLRYGGGHALILTGMASLYLTAPQARGPKVRNTANGIVRALGDTAMPSMSVLRIRRLVTQYNFDGLTMAKDLVDRWRQRRGNAQVMDILSR
jgi:tetraprenyl-beta-curcumene synthase